MKPEFLTNRENETVAQAIGGHLQYLLETWKKPFDVAIATAYFNPPGFQLIADQLERAGKVRLLLGAEPDAPERRIRKLDPMRLPEQEEEYRVRDALGRHTRNMEQDRDLLGFTYEADRLNRRLIAWLRSGRVDVRRLSQRFLHGKAYLVTTDNEGAIAGSSNFTFAGLARNIELNLGHYQPQVVGQVSAWFEEQWEAAEPYDLAALYESLYAPHSPYLVYLRMLYERYGPEVLEEAAATGIGLHLTGFQQDGVWRARRLLRDRHGVLIADGVGLGKSFIGGELMREALVERRQRVLLIAPASLRDGPWATFLLRQGLGIEVVSFDELVRDSRLNPEAEDGHTVLKFGINEYSMIVVDEAHAYRNPATNRAQVLRRLLAGSPPKDVVFLTATPVNNSLWDLYYLLSYFIKNDGAFADRGIRSLRDHFAEAMAEEPESLSPDRLFDILDAVAVRRTRHFVKRYYPNDAVTMNGVRVPITFPQPHVLKADYDLDAVMPGFFAAFAHALDCAGGHCQHEEPLRSEPTLSLARYAPSLYRLESDGDVTARELQLAGLLRSGLLKRFESSSYAFASTCRTMAASHEAFLRVMDQGYVATGGALGAWESSDSDYTQDLFGWVPEGSEPVKGFREADLRQAVEKDRELLLRFAEQAERIPADEHPKLVRLEAELEDIVQQADEEAIGDEDARNRRKVIIFSYFADTLHWVEQYLQAAFARNPVLAPYAGRMVFITGNEGDRTRALFGFAPESMEAPPDTEDRFDVLLSTDVLAEGVNLQQARHIINLDLPWNPMRLTQRHGRIDRIGSSHQHVYLRCFFPDRALDALLGLEERLHRKIYQAAASVGVESEVIPGSRVSDLSFGETREEIERLRNGDATLLETGGAVGTAFSGEEYRQELREGLENADVARAMKALPWGSGTGRTRAGARRGFVFCARVADHPDPLFRYVEMEGEPWISGDTLTSLAHAHASPDTPRELSAEMHELAYQAWELAQKHIYQEWTHSTDPRNLQPAVPKAMRDAAALIREHPPLGMPQESVEQLLDAIEAPYGVREQGLIRQALQSSASPLKAAEAVAQVVRELGLQPSPPPEALPVIAISDVHLVCWVGITPDVKGVSPREFGAPDQLTFAPDTQLHIGE